MEDPEQMAALNGNEEERRIYEYEKEPFNANTFTWKAIL